MGWVAGFPAVWVALCDGTAALSAFIDERGVQQNSCNVELLVICVLRSLLVVHSI